LDTAWQATTVPSGLKKQDWPQMNADKR
jgi:hypothetical protein